MQRNESNHPDHSTESTSIQYQVGRAIAKSTVIGSIVSGINLPIDATIQKLTHTNFSANSGLRGSTAGIMTFTRQLMRAYPSAATVSTLKNSAVSQREPLKDKMNSSREAPLEENQIESNQSIFNKTKFSLTTDFAVMGVISALDTSLTQYHMNQRTFRTEQANALLRGENFTIPKGKNFKENFLLHKTGMPVRFCRNSIMVGCFLNTERLATSYESLGPYYSKMAAYATTGTVGGITSHVLDMIYRNQVVNIKNNQAPKVLDIFKEIVKKQGMKGLTRGLGGSLFGTTLTMALIPAAEIIAEKVVTLGEQQINSAKNYYKNLNLFQPAPSPTTISTNEAEATAAMHFCT